MTTVKILKCTLPRENYVKDLGFHLRFKILISASFENHTLRHNLPCHTLKVKFLVFVSWDLTSQTFLKTYPFNHKRPQSPRCIVAEPLCPWRTPQGLHLVCRCGSRALGCSQLGAQNQGGRRFSVIPDSVSLPPVCKLLVPLNPPPVEQIQALGSGSSEIRNET